MEVLRPTTQRKKTITELYTVFRFTELDDTLNNGQLRLYL